MSVLACQQYGALLLPPRHQRGAVLQEALLFLAAERVGDQLLLAQGVDVGAVDLELVMQVWPGGKTGGADVADDLALLDRSAGANVLGEALHVGIERPVAG